MVVLWQVAAVAVSLGAVPHPDLIDRWATTLLGKAPQSATHLYSDDLREKLKKATRLYGDDDDDDDWAPAPSPVGYDNDDDEDSGDVPGCHGHLEWDQELIDERLQGTGVKGTVSDDGATLTDQYGDQFKWVDCKGTLNLTPGAGEMGKAAWGQLMPQIIMSLLLAFCYKSGVSDQKPYSDAKQTMAKQDNPDGNFRHGLFGCCGDCAVCWCVWMCPGVKFADTNTLVTGNYWQSFGTWAGVQFVTAVVAIVAGPIVYPPPSYNLDFSAHSSEEAQHQQAQDFANALMGIFHYFIALVNVIGWIACALRGLYFGAVARKQLREKLGQEVTPAIMGQDCLIWTFCGCCALSQEAMEVDAATNVDVTCPCGLAKPRTKGGTKAREVAPCDNYERLLGDAVVLEEGGR